MGIDGSLGVAAGAVALELAHTEPVQDRLGHDRARRVSGAEKYNAQGLIAAYDLHGVTPPRHAGQQPASAEAMRQPQSSALPPQQSSTRKDRRPRVPSRSTK